jgi:hypothetical protein
MGCLQQVVLHPAVPGGKKEVWVLGGYLATVSEMDYHDIMCVLKEVLFR